MCLEDDSALGADFQALVACGSALFNAMFAVFRSGSGNSLGIASLNQVAESTETLAVGRGVEGEVPLAGGEPLREALVDWKHGGSIELWSGRDCDGKDQESNDRLHHGD